MSKIEYFYAGYSAFAYIGSAEFMKIAKSSGRDIDHRPFDLRKVVAINGPAPVTARSSAHRDYYFGREIERWAEERKIPILADTPTHHANDITLSNCLLIAGLVLGHNIDDLAHEMLKSHWLDNFDLDNAEDLAKICRAVDLDPVLLLETAVSKEVKDIYTVNTNEAIDRSVFGSPTYFVDGDMFYGQDHLEMVARATKTPYHGIWPR
jgi:2-hydroxychromene-2-carboxylate isomerase